MALDIWQLKKENKKETINGCHCQKASGKLWQSQRRNALKRLTDLIQTNFQLDFIVKTKCQTNLNNSKEARHCIYRCSHSKA